MEFANHLIFVGAMLLLVSIFSSLVSARIGAPLLLVFLVIGMLAGEDGPGGIHYDDFAGSYLLGSLGLAIILFDSGLNTRLASYRLAMAPALTLATLGVLITSGITGAAASWLLDLPPMHGLLFGAIVGSTDAAAVFFLLHVGGLNLKDRVRAALEIESGSNDPMAVFLTIGLIELILAGQAYPGWPLLLHFLQQLVIGGAFGIVGGLLLAQAINRLNLAAGLYPLMSLAGALAIFGAAAVLDGSGFLAVYLAGLVLGNRRLRAFQNLSRFHDGLTWLSQMVMFLMLGLLVTPTKLPELMLPVLGIALVLILAARPAAVLLCLLPFRFTLPETAFISWVGLRGAVSILLALLPVLSNLDHARTLFSAAFLVVMISLIIQGWTIRPAARKLGLAVPGRAGPAQRVELDLPGQIDYEMVAYPVPKDSIAAQSPGLPEWAELVMVIRGGVILSMRDFDHLRSGDQAYLLTPRTKLAALDRVFASREGESDLENLDFFGEFILSADAGLGDLAAAYGLPVPDYVDPQESLGGLFQRHFAGSAVVGDRLSLGSIVLVANKLDEEGRVSHVGLKLRPDKPAEAESLSGRAATLWQRLRRGLGGRV